MNNEKAAGQLVGHAHFHIIPRFTGDGHEHWGATTYKKSEAKEVSKKILKNL